MLYFVLAAPSLALFDWARANGAFVSDSLRISEAHPRGLAVTAPVATGEALIVLPPHLQLGLDALESCSELQAMAAQCDSPALWSMQLGVALIAARRQGEDSQWHGYLEQLPPTLSSALAPWSGEASAIAAWPPTAQRVNSMRSTLRRLHATLAPASLDFDELCWATAAVASRAYRVRGEQGAGAGAAAARLLPVIDLANYDTAERATATVGNAPGDYELLSVGLLATTDLAAGDEVTVDYGCGRPLDNERLLLEYGFVLPGLPHDMLTLPLGAISAGLQHVGGAAALEAMSDEEAAELARLQAVALGKLGDVQERGLRFEASGAPDEETRALALALCAQAPAELAAAEPPPALTRRAAAAVRAVAAAALEQMGEGAAGASAAEAEADGGFEAAARGYCEARRALLRRAAVVEARSSP